MNRSANRTLLVALVTAWLAGCSAPRPDPSMSSEEASAAASEVAAAFGGFASSSHSELESAALARLTATPLPLQATIGLLPRGVYTFDAAGDEWVLTGPSDVLELNWEFEHEGEHDGRLVVDWDADAPTTFVRLESGQNHEAPQGARANLEVDGDEAGELAVGASYVVNACGFSEPESVDLSGFLGHDDERLELTAIDFTFEEGAQSTFTSHGDVSARADDDSLSLSWNVALNGSVARDAATCHVEDVSVTSGEVELELAADVFGKKKSLGLSADFSDVMFDEGSGAFSVALADGRVLLDGVLAIAFDGVLDDANRNGVPGDNLSLTFAGGETMTLEEFLLDHFPRLAGVLRVGAALR